ncbi:hypothetical protein ACLMAL_28900 [Nocardia sp. CWNU-33]|uniref:hypothetical protein n=1 Tax=Nocardia sp. CWNU-33 TaxID=3392117 RepID=UPI00398F35DA
MTRYADRKARIRAYMREHPGMKYGEAARHIDNQTRHATTALTTTRVLHRRIQRSDPGALRSLLVRALRDLRTTPHLTPPVIRLARGLGAIVIVGHISDQLRDHAIPTRDNYVTVGRACAQTIEDLGPIVGHYLAGVHGPNPQRLADSAADPLLHSHGADPEMIASGMITFGAKVSTMFRSVAHDETALPEHRRVADRSNTTATLG